VRSHQHFVCEEELESIDEYLASRSCASGPSSGRKEVDPTPRRDRPQHDPQPLLKTRSSTDSPEGGAGSILIRSRRENSRVVIEVEDDGMGFLMDALEADVERDQADERASACVIWPAAS
jgi:hypothetical protein